MVSAHGLHHFVNGWCNYHWQWQPSLLRVGCTCCCPINDNIPTITPFDIYVGQLSACFFSTTSLQLAALPSLPFWERLQHKIPLRAYQSCSVRNDFSSLTPRLITPLKRIFPSATIIEYFNVITSSPLFQESTHPGVASALCSTLGTTPYFSVSLSLLVLRVQVALYL